MSLRHRGLTLVRLRVRIVQLVLAAVLLAACGTIEAAPGAVTSARSAAGTTVGRDGALVVPLDPSGGQDYKLHRVRLDGSRPERLTPASSEISGAETSPDWSPDGRRLVFVGYTRGGVDLFTINADGSDLRNLTNRPGHYLRPSWSPDGRLILFTLSTNDGSRIATIDPVTGQITPLTAATGHDSWPVWSPSGDRIAFLRFTWGPCKNLPPGPESTPSGSSIACDGDPITTLYTMNPDGSGLRSLVVTEFAEDPRWSPDGATIALTTYRASRQGERVLLVKADGSGAVPLTPEPLRSSSPRWSPDGHQLSATIIDPGGSEAAIAVMDATGANMRRLTPLLYGWHAWSPDGSRLVVFQPRISPSGGTTGRSDLFVVDASGENQQRVLDNAAIAPYPAWWPDHASGAGG